jgi:hypothetical protein
VAVLADDPTAFVLDDEPGLVVAGKLATAGDRFRLLVVR